jgi:hypothetical protein
MLQNQATTNTNISTLSLVAGREFTADLADSSRKFKVRFWLI